TVSAPAAHTRRDGREERGMSQSSELGTRGEPAPRPLDWIGTARYQTRRRGSDDEYRPGEDRSATRDAHRRGDRGSRYSDCGGAGGTGPMERDACPGAAADGALLCAAGGALDGPVVPRPVRKLDRPLYAASRR